MRKTKRITSLLLALCMLMAFVPNGITVSAASVFSGGSGTEADPYIIEDAADFIQLATDVNSGTTYEGVYFALTDDVELTTVGGFVPIGNSSDNPFMGNFDGQNHTVTLNITAEDYAGIFGYISGDITIKNIRTEGTVTATETGYYAGGIVAYRSSDVPKIINCHNNAAVTGSGYVGGIGGRLNYADIYNCSNSAAVITTSSTGYAGGICAEGHVYNCYNSGAVKYEIGEEETFTGHIGGIVGSSWYCYVQNCVNSGAVTGGGAIVGHADCSDGDDATKYFSNNYYVKTEGLLGIKTILGTAQVEDDDSMTDVEKETLFTEEGLAPLNLYVKNNKSDSKPLFYWQVTDEEGSKVISIDDADYAPALPYIITNNSEHLTVKGSANSGEIVEITVVEMPAYAKVVITLDGEVLEANEEGKYVFTMPEADVTVDAEIEITGLEQDEDGRYEISTSDELNIFAKAVNDGMLTDADAVLTADVTASTEDGFEPIGTEENPYGGYFYADGHTVTLKITVGTAFDETTVTGLFGVTEYAYIYDIILKGSVDGGENIDAYTGALIGVAEDYTYVYNVYSEAAVSGSGYIGGIVGNAGTYAYLRNIINNGTVSQSSTAEDKKAVGAIVGIGGRYYENVYYNSDKNSGMYDAGYKNSGELAEFDYYDDMACTAEDLFTDDVMDYLNAYSMDDGGMLFWDVVEEDDKQTVAFVEKCPAPLYEINPANYMSDDVIYDMPYYSRAGKTVTVYIDAYDIIEEYEEADDVLGIEVKDSRGNIIETKQTYSYPGEHYYEYEFEMPERDVIINVLFDYGMMTGENGEYYITSVEDLIAFANIVDSGETDANAKVVTKELNLWDWAEDNDYYPEDFAELIGRYDAYGGEFDGNGAEIYWCGPLFYETDGAVIKNLNMTVYSEDCDTAGIVMYAEDTLIDNCNVRMYTEDCYYVGGIANETYNSTITNCSVSAEGYMYYFGGIACYAGDAVIANCVLNECYVDAYEYGGIVYSSYGETEIYNCVNNDYFDSSEVEYAGAIVGAASLSELTLENNFYNEEVDCYDVCYDYNEGDYCDSMTDPDSAVSEDEIWGGYIPAKLNEYIEANPELVKGVELNKWSAYYDEYYEWVFACFADKNNPEIYSINQDGIKVGVFDYDEYYIYGSPAGEDVYIDYVPSGAQITVTDEDGNEIELTAVAEDEDLGTDLLSEVPENVEIALLVDDSLEEDAEIAYYTFTMPESDVTVSVTLDAGIEETTVIDGKTYAVVKTADDFIKAVTSIANGNNALNVLLAEDIELTEEVLENYPVYDMEAIMTGTAGYNGTFDGAGHTVTFENLTGENASMLGAIGEDGIVKNITVDGTISGTEAASGIAIVNAGTILNCVNKADISGTQVAGLVGMNYPMEEPMSMLDFPMIINCINKGNISGTEGSAAIAYISMGIAANVVNEGTIVNPGEDGNMIFNGDVMGSGMLDLTVEEGIILAEAAAEFNSMLEMSEAMLESGDYPSEMEALAWIYESMKEWSVLETDSGAEMIFADEENAPYYFFVTPERETAYKTGDTVEFTFDTSILDEGFELSGARVVMEYSDNEIEMTPVDGKADTYSFTMPDGSCYAEMLTEATGVEKDEDGYYLVKTLDDLMKVKATIDNGNNAINIRLTADIEGYTDTPIGGNYGYNGTFDGNNHSITVAMDAGEEYYDEYGLFGILDNDAVVKDLTIAGTISANADYIGSVAGGSYGAIINCVNDATVINNSEYGEAGGIVGWVESSPDIYVPSIGLMADEEADEETEEEPVFPGLVRGCVNNGEVYGYYAGGIASYCYNYMLSGIMSENTVTVENCVNNGEVSGDYVGGITSYMDGIAGKIADLNNCVNNGEIYAEYEAGGIASGAEYAVIDNCVNNAYIECGDENVGGIVGDGDGELIVQNCVNNGDVYADYCDAGGIVGDAEDGIEIINSINNGGVYAEEYSAGIIGSCTDELKIKNCYNSGNVTGDYAFALAIHEDYYDDDYLIPLSLMSEEETTEEEEESDILITNSFYLQNDDVNYGLESANFPMEFDSSEAVTEEDILSGYVTAKLNSGVKDGLNSWAVKDGAVVFADDDDETEVYYEIIINENITGGSVTADKVFAKAGETVTLTIESETEGKMPVITGVKLDENNSFVMPAETVRINAVFGDRFTGTEKNDVIELAENVKAEDILLADYVEFENADITREFKFALAEESELPEGLKLSYGRVVGTPTKAGTYTVVFDVTDEGAVSLMALAPDKAIGEAQLTLTFNVAKTYKVTVTDTENGSVTADKEYAKAGDEVTLTVTANDGYVLDKIAGVIVDENNTFIMPRKDVTVSAVFVPKTYAIIIGDTENGSIVADKQTAKAGETVTLTVTPDKGYVLSEITGISVDENNTFVMPEKDVTISAVFVTEADAEKTYTITIAETTNGSIVADKTSAKAGEKITLTVTPAEGYELSEITGVEIAEDNTFTMPARDVTISAVFAEKETCIEGTSGNDGNVTIKYFVPEDMDYTLIIAKYNEDGSVKNIEVIASADDTNNGELVVKADENVKVMLWSNLSAMVPLCESYEVK